jgi:RimJ/RimL family protein N-acetyltransferase
MDEVTMDDVRRIELPDGRTVTVRPGTSDDVDGLASLYAGLSDEDIYLRFFTAHRPGPDLFGQMVTVGDRGGALLVAEVEQDGAPQIVGDVWYSRLPDGNGEFAITVAKPWRGWLGAYLLDALLDVAAAHGIPNLEAEVLLRNRAMMALVRRRGCVRLGDDGSSARVAVGATSRIPTWAPGAGHPRVLVEGRRNWSPQDEATHRGIEVAVCPGPPANGGRCPALSGGACPLVAEADAVVLSLAPGDQRTREMVRAHRALRPDVPIIIDHRSTDVPDDEHLTTLTRAMTDEDVIDLILTTLAGSEQNGPEVEERRP